MENLINYTFTLFWLTGEHELVKGKTIAEAMTLAGYSNGAVRALDFYGQGNIIDEWKWDKEKITWNHLKPIY